MKTFKEFLSEQQQDEVVNEVSTVRVDVSSYQNSHGFDPSRNTSKTAEWFFAVDRRSKLNKEGEDYIVVKGPFKDAAEKAKVWAQKKGETTVYVLP